MVIEPYLSVKRNAVIGVGKGVPTYSNQKFHMLDIEISSLGKKYNGKIEILE